jgi:ABC-type dipeptide/oligopeptide/nickel transport system ATPase component
MGVMYAGQWVEPGPADSMLNYAQSPQHPYTQLLIRAVSELGVRKKREVKTKKQIFHCGNTKARVVLLLGAVCKTWINVGVIFCRSGN